MPEPEWGSDVVPLPPLFQTDALRHLLHDVAWRRALEAKLEALGLNLEDIVHES